MDIKPFSDVCKTCFSGEPKRSAVLNAAFIEDSCHPAPEQFAAEANGVRERISFSSIGFFRSYSDYGFGFRKKVAVFNAP